MDALTGQELVDQFVAEALESLRDVPGLLESFHRDPTQTEAIHAAFRAVHSMKGTAACLGLDAYKIFVHRLENVLSQIRDGKTPLSDALLELLIEGLDHLEGMLRAAAEGKILQQLGPGEQAFLDRLPTPGESSRSASDSLPHVTGQASLDELFRTVQTEAASATPPLPPSEPAEEPTSPEATLVSSSANSTSPARYVRIKESYLDEFLTDVSHLFITGELLRELQTRIPEAALGRDLAEELQRTCQELRLQLTALHRSAASLRRVSAGEVFAPYPRMARSLAAQLKKKVRVHIQGDEVEIDRALARELEAPLTHLIRNAIDHGIETPEQRQARNRDPIGDIWLKAERTRHWVRIRVEDDGQGIDPDRLRRKAVEKGWYTPQQANQLSDAEALQLIFHPGFSTAEKVTEVSGRGVGMDVVRAVVHKHQGTIHVDSQPGNGTKVCLTFPVREAVLVLDGLLIRDGGHLLVIPLEHVREILQVQPQALHQVQDRLVLPFRGGCYETVWVHEVLGWKNGRTEPMHVGSAALIGPPGEELCLRFAELLGHRQVVVHSLDEILPGCPKTQGVALLGGGRLALVLNIPEILKDHQQRARAGQILSQKENGHRLPENSFLPKAGMTSLE